MEEQVLRQVVGAKHSALARDVQDADLGRREPVGLQHAHGSVVEPDQAADQILVGGVYLAPGLRVDAHDLGPAEVPHHVHVVRREVDHDAYVADALRERTQPPGVVLEHAPQLACRQTLLQLEDRGVVALDVADRKDALRGFCRGHQLVGLRQRAGDRLLDEHMRARRQGVQHDRMVLVGGHRDHHRVRLLALEQLRVRRVHLRQAGGGDPLRRASVGVGEPDEVGLGQVVQHPDVVPAHAAGPDDGDSRHFTKR